MRTGELLFNATFIVGALAVLVLGAAWALDVIRWVLG